jgi:hypothetical protein
LDRVRRALEQKCPKLLAARTDGRLAILALESNDIALANFNIVVLAIKQALKERNDPPDLVMLVETDGGPFYGWVIRNETGIRFRDGYYMAGDFDAHGSPPRAGQLGDDGGAPLNQSCGLCLQRRPMTPVP